MTSEIGADSARSHDGKVVPKTTPCSFAAGKLVQGTAALLSVGLMLNWRTALLASLSLTGRFSPVWEAGEGGEGGAGLWPLLERSTAAKRPQPCHGASSTHTTPWHRQHGSRCSAARGCTPEDVPTPTALIHCLLHHLEPWDTQQLPLTSSHYFTFSITACTALHTACPAWQHPSCCQTAPCEPTGGLH